MKDHICMVGGDKRMYHASLELRKRGYITHCCGVDGEKSVPLDEAFAQSDAVVLPLPYTRDREKIFSTGGSEIDICDVFSLIEPRHLILSGGTDERLRSLAEARGARLCDYSESERFLQKNAVLTAEGAVEVLMRESDVSVSGTDVAVLGYGRIGKPLADRLRAFGAKVTVFARRTSARFEALSRGIRSLDFPFLGETIGGFDAVFNTVPARITDCALLAGTKRGALLIELASRPYGLDPADAEEAGRKVILASGLPGKVAPRSAGIAVADEIAEVLEK